jgi:two-component system CheB/CheR fusion protein
MELRQGTAQRSLAALHLQLLEEYAPPSLVVNDEYQIVHLSGGAGRYLLVPGGDVTRDVFKLARPELRLELRAALVRAAQERSPVQVRGMRVSVDRTVRHVDLTVRPVIREGDGAQGFFVILFEERAASGVAMDEPAPAIHVASPGDAEVARHLNDELTRAHATLRLTVEQYETQVEEERATNEELQAMNEELRSSAEELETSKEELQSVNEELTTVNQELKLRVDELAVANSQFQNLITATDVAAVFLDRSLRVRLSTPRARDVFNLLPLDVGRPLSDITSRLPDVPLHRDIQDVLDRLEQIERQIHTDDGRWYRMRALPYQMGDEHVAGVVVTLHDITERRRAEAVAEQTAARLRLVYDEAVDYAIMSITLAGDVDSWSTGAQRAFGYSPDQIVGQPAAVLFTSEDRMAGEPQKELRQALETGRVTTERWYVRRDGTRVLCGSSIMPAGGGSGFVKIARDRTPQEDRD